MTPKPKCEDIGFEHYWEEYAAMETDLGEMLPEMRRCINCGSGMVKKWVDADGMKLESAYETE